MPRSSRPSAPSRTLDDAEEAHFSSFAEDWWDPQGPMASLHAFNPVRLQFILQALRDGLGHKGKSLKGLKILDIGCGGGVLAEPLAQRGAEVTGLDASAEVISAAAAHAEENDLKIDYRYGTVEQFRPKHKYDVVIASEVLEHVADPAAFLAEATHLLAPKGVLIITTLNRTLRALFLGILAAEHLLKIVPMGTHSWKKFLKPSEVAGHLRPLGLTVKGLSGARYNPLTKQSALAPGQLDVNYLLWAQR